MSGWRNYFCTFIRIIIFLLIASFICVEPGQIAKASALTGWTSVGSAGTVDESSLSNVTMNGSFIEIQSYCVLFYLRHALGCSTYVGDVSVRYNVNFYSEFTAFQLAARFKDSGDMQRVVLTLKKVDLQTGVESIVRTLDSNAFPPSTTYQRETTGCAPVFGLDAIRNAYYIDAVISNNSGIGSAPGIQYVQIEGCSTL
jgi:hypothetical protein